ncbi:PaaI family thioesterase [Corynebacterium alimapuense]|uniref:Thioesterase n=1 Tax=Corynebacterium alimapuense TaxID=1576874 RepID=A0A3M8K984_9CORY|nr:PaaI family thioesterase [Corynebacterium alimapuense]RNE49720.1 thioesterase [Corynebacterium alimapuense]
MDIRDALAQAAQSPEGLDQAGLTAVNDSLGGLDSTLGIRYTHIGPSSVMAEITVTEQHLQPAGLVNGGLYCALAESVGSLAGMVAAASPVVGVNNNTDFISSVSSGVITAEATPIQLGRRTQLWQILMTHQDKVVARSTLRTMPVRSH